MKTTKQLQEIAEKRELMSVEDMTNFCKQKAREIWDLEFNIHIEINSRLKKYLGRFTSKKSASTSIAKPIKIEVAKDLLKYGKQETINDVLLHELTHWALCCLNKPYGDRDITFIKELKKVGASPRQEIFGECYRMLCSECNEELGKVFTKTKKDNLEALSKSLCCMAKIYSEFIIVEDTNSNL